MTQRTQRELPTIGDRIKAARKAASVTQAELAKHIGYTTQHISNIECGVYKPSSRTIAAINRALRVQLTK